uniref:Small heat shock protein n=2 Tax=Artemia franciscana TaxID=6661 RepID=A0A346QR04_ARTSF|nr:small heat shock protein [Artemia franciscana]
MTTLVPWTDQWTDPWEDPFADLPVETFTGRWRDPFSTDVYKPYGLPRTHLHRRRRRRRIRTVQRVFSRKGTDVRTREDDKEWEITMQLPGFLPSDITVNSTDKEIIVHGVHKERPDYEGEEGYVSREIRRRFVPPKTINPGELSSTFSSDGELRIHAPKAIPGEPRQRRIQIMPAPIGSRFEGENEEEWP